MVLKSFAGRACVQAFLGQRLAQPDNDLL